MAMFTCKSCQAEFSIPETTLSKYPNWVPKICLKCKNLGTAEATPRTTAAEPLRSGVSKTKPSKPRNYVAEENLTLAQVLERYSGGPDHGVFTDGAASPNPGPGGWGAVYVVAGKVVGQSFGKEENTTNNRMELTALIEGSKLVPAGTPAVLYTDSQLCVKTINEWAKAWKAKGWKRSGGEVKNLDLVQELYGITSSRPELSLQWIKAHSGLLWNEYADSLATAYRRPSP